MADYRIHHPTKKLRGMLRLPGSKSESNRLLILKELYQPKLELKGLSESRDTLLMQKALKEYLETDQIDVQDAGTAMRFLLAFLAAQATGEWVLSGTPRMHQRPIAVLVEALRKLGAKIDYLQEEGYPPLRIKGQSLRGGELWIDASLSSQYISALMMIAPRLAEGLSLKFRGASVSAPYIFLTANLMRSLGFTVFTLGDEVRVPPQTYSAGQKDYQVEADWSAASYWFAALSLAEEGEIYLPGFKQHSFQGDAILSQFFAPLGVEQVFIGSGIRIRKAEPFPARRSLNLVANPDLAQSLAPAYAAHGVPIELKGLQTLRIKETDRLEALKNELQKFGVTVKLEGNNLTLSGSFKSSFQSIESYDDHRMAMGFLPLALKHEVLIRNAAVVEKSYPQFWDHCRELGFEIQSL